MLVLLVWSYAPVASRIPLAEDWLAVAPLTGNAPDLAAWLWEQNNEHRMPVARLLLLGTLEAAKGDYRAGGYLIMSLLAGTAAGLILFARHMRGGRTDAADAAFPLLLLHFGHSHILLLPWLIFFVLSIVFVIAAGSALFAPGSVGSWRTAGIAGTALLLLPLSGFIGLFFVPPLTGYLLYAGWACWSGTRGWPRRRGIGIWLTAASAGTIATSALYFIGYQHPWWNPPGPGVVPSLKVALKVLSLGFGPAPEFWWAPGVAAMGLFLSVSLWESLRRVRQSGPSRDRALGAALFLAASIAFAFVVGWGRAGYVPEFGIPIRYVMLVQPAFVACCLTLVASGSPLARAAQRAFAVAMLILLPFNTVAGHRFFADWYREGMTRVEEDLQRGVPIPALAVRHQRFLVHWWTPAELERHMRWLGQAGIVPFDRAVANDRQP